MDTIEKEIRRIVDEAIDEKKKLFAARRWEKWEDSEDSKLLSDLHDFVTDQALLHGRTRSAIEERIIKYL